MRKPTVPEGSSLLIAADCFTRARPFSGIIAQISHRRVHVWFDLAQLFRTFRSKEIWLDVFTILLNNATWCCVSQTERDLIAAEIKIAEGTWTRAEGLIKWIAGDIITMEEITKDSKGVAV